MFLIALYNFYYKRNPRTVLKKEGNIRENMNILKLSYNLARNKNDFVFEFTARRNVLCVCVCVKTSWLHTEESGNEPVVVSRHRSWVMLYSLSVGVLSDLSDLGKYSRRGNSFLGTTAVETGLQVSLLAASLSTKIRGKRLRLVKDWYAWSCRVLYWGMWETRESHVF